MGRHRHAVRGDLRNHGEGTAACPGRAYAGPGRNAHQPNPQRPSQRHRQDPATPGPRCRQRTPQRRHLAGRPSRHRRRLGRKRDLARRPRGGKALHRTPLPERGGLRDAARRQHRRDAGDTAHLRAAVPQNTVGKPRRHVAVPGDRLPHRPRHRARRATLVDDAAGAGPSAVLDIAAGAHHCLDRVAGRTRAWSTTSWSPWGSSPTTNASP